MKELLAYVKKNGLETRLSYDAEAAPQDRWVVDIVVGDTIVQGVGPTSAAAIKRALQHAGEEFAGKGFDVV